MSIDILHLFPDELGINGDVGNAMALAERARARGIDATITKIGLNDELPEHADAVVIGSGPLAAVQAVLPALERMAPQLRRWRDRGVEFVAIGGGWDALGERITLADGAVLNGAGVFPTRSIRGGKQRVGETVVRMPEGLIVTGFSNHDSIMEGIDQATMLGTVLKGHGNEATKKSAEGYRRENLLASNLHGSLLTMNPRLADDALYHAAEHARARGAIANTIDLNLRTSWLDEMDGYAEASRRALIARVGVKIEHS